MCSISLTRHLSPVLRPTLTPNYQANSSSSEEENTLPLQKLHYSYSGFLVVIPDITYDSTISRFKANFETERAQAIYL
jgi:hypothetical protein